LFRERLRKEFHRCCGGIVEDTRDAYIAEHCRGH
jgi:hypothetical protein